MRIDRQSVLAVIDAHPDGITTRGIAHHIDKMNRADMPLGKRIAEAIRSAMDENRNLPTINAVYAVCNSLADNGHLLRSIDGRWRRP